MLVTVEDKVRQLRLDAVVETFVEGLDVRLVLVHLKDGDTGRLTEPNAQAGRQSAGAEALLLTATIHEIISLIY